MRVSSLCAFLRSLHDRVPSDSYIPPVVPPFSRALLVPHRSSTLVSSAFGSFSCEPRSALHARSASLPSVLVYELSLRYFRHRSIFHPRRYRYSLDSY